MTVGAIKVHEFNVMDSIFDKPSSTFGFYPKIGEAIGATTGTCQAILLGRRTFETVAPAWRMTGSARR